VVGEKGVVAIRLFTCLPHARLDEAGSCLAKSTAGCVWMKLPACQQFTPEGTRIHRNWEEASCKTVVWAWSSKAAM